ncbi:transposase family protein [Azospirillum doebereinerae]
MPLDAPATPAATSTATLPRWAEEPPVPPEGSLVPGSRFAEEQWVMAAGMLARGASFLHVARALGCSRTTLWRAYYGSQALRVRVWWERQALNREAELRLASLRDLVAQQVERLVSMGDPATVRWAADRLGLFGAPDAGLHIQPGADAGHLSPSPAPGEGRGPPRSGGKGEGLSEHEVRTTPDSPSPSPLRGSPPSPGTGEGLVSALDDDAVPGAFREQVLPDPSLVAGILAQPEADGPKGVYPWTLNPDDAYPSLGSAEERRGKRPCGRSAG